MQAPTPRAATRLVAESRVGGVCDQREEILRRSDLSRVPDCERVVSIVLEPGVALVLPVILSGLAAAVLLLPLPFVAALAYVLEWRQ